MKWESTLILDENIERGFQKGAEKLSTLLGGKDPDLAVVFVSGIKGEALDRVSQLVRAHIKPNHWLGCTAGGVIGHGREIENRPAVSISVALLPNVSIQPFHIEPGDFASSEAMVNHLLSSTAITTDDAPHFLLLANTFTTDTESFLHGLDQYFSKSNKTGGLASGGSAPKDNLLFLNDRVHNSGLIGVALAGNIQMDTIVAQGCRPIGLPLFVTRCRDNLISELDGQPPVELLKSLFEQLSEPDQQLFQRALFLGIIVSADLQRVEPGDFLIRSILGGDPDTGVLAVGSLVRQHQVVQFHLRDPVAARADLEESFGRYLRTQGGRPIAGALMFSCVGRGQQLFGRANHDTDLFHSHLGQIPLGGFFCNGEIGQIHGKTFLHGFTSSFGLFRAKEN